MSLLEERRPSWEQAQPSQEAEAGGGDGLSPGVQSHSGQFNLPLSQREQESSHYLCSGAQEMSRRVTATGYHGGPSRELLTETKWARTFTPDL